MARLQTYGALIAIPGRRSFYSALKETRNAIYQQATQLRETFGGHSAEYYTQEILQRGHLERGRRKPSRWNAFLHQELKAQNAGTPKLFTLSVATQTKLLGLPAGQPKLKLNDAAGEIQ